MLVFEYLLLQAKSSRRYVDPCMGLNLSYFVSGRPDSEIAIVFFRGSVKRTDAQSESGDCRVLRVTLHIGYFHVGLA